MSDTGELAVVSAAIGIVAGMRSMSAPAIITSRIGPRPLHTAFKLMALGEMAADKTKRVPDRTEPPALTGRIVIGGACAAVVAHTAGHFVAGAALIGAAAAAGSTYLFYHLRKAATERTGVPDAVVALCEDGLVFAAGNQIASHDFTRKHNKRWWRRGVE